MKWQNSILINRPVETVFAFVTDPDGGTKWHRANQISPLSDDPIGLGSQYRVKGKFLLWEYDSVSEVSEFEENRLVTYQSDTGMYSYVLRYQMEPKDGGTYFTEIGEANPQGLLKFAIQIFAGGAKKNSARGLKLLKDELETMRT